MAGIKRKASAFEQELQSVGSLQAADWSRPSVVDLPELTFHQLEIEGLELGVCNDRL